MKQNATARGFLLTVFSLFFLLSGGASADNLGVFVGLDMDGDLTCDGADDMNVQGMSVGDSIEIDLYWDNTGVTDSLISMNCTFCIESSAAVSLDTFYYSAAFPTEWNLVPVKSTPHPVVGVDQWIIDCWPGYQCWLVQSTDFTLVNPIGPGKHLFGTLAFRAAADGDLGLAIDGHPDHSGWMYRDLSIGNCEAGLPQDDQCLCVNSLTSCETNAVEGTDWGTIKKLFR